MLFPSALTEVGIQSRGICEQESSAMPAVFQEVSAAAGVDEGATPFPGMIVSRFLYSHAKRVDGITDSALGISLIGDARTSQRELMAHEAGHYIEMA